MKNSFLINSAALAALIMAGALLSGKVEINLQHHAHLPTEFSNKSTIEVTTPRGIFDNWFNTHRVIHIRTSSEFKGTDTVKDIAKILQEADSNDIVIFHIVGVGGQVDTVMYLINNIKASKAKVIMSVEGPSYSGHAYLATVGDELIMMTNSYLMFHTSSGYGTDCSKATGYDRTVPNTEHCQDFMDNHLYLANKMIDGIKILTPYEKERIKTGHDVYITADDYNKNRKR